MAQKIVELDPSKPIEPASGAQALVILLGDFVPALNDQIRSIFSRVVAPVAAQSSALIIGDARNAGCAPLIVVAALELDRPPAVIGVVANDRTAGDIDPNHELVVRLPAAWSGQA